MKSFFLMATIFVAGLISAKSTEVNTETNEVKAISIMNFYYDPITLTSSCGYTQTVDVGPNDSPDCWMTDLQQMEEECDSPFSNPQQA